MTSLTELAGPLVAPAQRRVRQRLVVTGVVQGVGFRPFVYLSATDLGITGWVINDSAGVVIDAEGGESDLAAFAHRLEADCPPLARVDAIAVTDLPPAHGATGTKPDGAGGHAFAIRESNPSGGGRALVPPDVATCDACLAELADPGNRRYRHPFISCTNCGPRFTIIVDLPYDRPTTTMAAFAMCASCASEYANPADRRFHAQTIACLDCGPRLELVRPHRPRREGEAALAEARRMLAQGAILAVKGIGGYHLMCDATDEGAVSTLRRRKCRGAKPFAVMVRDLEAARRYALVGNREADLLSSPARPIVLVDRRADGSTIAPSVAPAVPDLGLLLAYTPLHTLLLGWPGDPPFLDALVATSGNLSGETIVADDDEAFSRLAPLVDAWLVHDRAVHVACDDSVLRVVDGEPLPLRRARGYAPLPVSLALDVSPTLATGADLKNTCCLASGRHAWVSQHIGDMDDMATLGAFTRTENLMESLTGVVPSRLVADAHPAYRSSAWARRHAQGRPVSYVQHHHAHVASLMGEHEMGPGTRVIGFAFDGTGLGPDGAVWGGEVLVGGYEGFERFAHLGYVPMAGGNSSVQRPYRMALAHLAAAGVGWDGDLAPVAACPAREAALLARQFSSGSGCVPTSSMGRLFDAIASLCAVRQVVDYEAQAAIELEGLARLAAARAGDDNGYRFDLGPAVDGGLPNATGERPMGALSIGAAPVVRGVVEDLRLGTPVSEVAARFHCGVADMVSDIAHRARRSYDLDVVGLTGGVFQNPLLLGECTRVLSAGGFTVLRHRLVPPNDGGLALGQVLVLAASTVEKGGP